jgi:mannosylglycerate hydrolase
VTRAGDRHGLALVSDGLAEYEATPDGAVAVTLVRAVGELSRNDLPERPGHAGWPVPTPGAQCAGRFGAILAIVPHGPLSPGTLDAIERAADDALLPLRGETLRAALHVPNPTLGAELEGEGLAFGAIKEAEDGAGVVLRCVNVTDVALGGRWRLGFPVKRATLARLDETPTGDALPIEHDAGAPMIAFEAGPRAVVTLLLKS